MISALKSTNLALRFALELAALAALAWWGWRTRGGPLAKPALAIDLPIAAATAWATFAAPGTATSSRAEMQVGGRYRAAAGGMPVIGE